jgi:hypothetical protein
MVRRCCNTGSETARMGARVHTGRASKRPKWFEETLERAPYVALEAPDNIDEVVARYVDAASKYGLKFV